MLTVSVGTILEVTGGKLLSGADDVVVRGVAIDSREVTPGMLFVALPGERVDGHDYLADALSRGARGALVSRDDAELRASLDEGGRAEAFALVEVEDVQQALEAIAAWHRQRLTCPVIGITGSTGKTTTKDFLRSVLATRLNVVATSGNRNNELGVPLTVLEADASTEALVVEMAMRGPGQIAALCEIVRPTAGLITNVGVGHIEILGSQAAIASAKGELAMAVPETGRVFLNADDEWSAWLEARLDTGVTRYGLGPEADVTATDIEVTGKGTPSFTLVCEQGTARVTLPRPGRHNIYNALAAASVGLYLELSLSDIVTGLEQAAITHWRMEVFESASGITILNDAYNANPTSMKAAVVTLGEIPGTGQRVAVLGDMAELGSLAELAHFEVGQLIANSNVDTLVTVGPRARHIADGALAAGMPADAVRPCAEAPEASEVLDDLLEAGDVVLVKASRVMELELVVEGLIAPRGESVC